MPIGQEIARLARSPVFALIEQQERSRKRMLEALSGASLRDQIGSVMEQHRREQEDQLAQVRKLLDRPAVFDQLNAMMGGLEAQRLDAFSAARRAFESPGLKSLQDSMTALDRSMGIGSLAEQLRFPAADSMAELHRVMSGPGESIREMVERMSMPSLGSAIEQATSGSRAIADLFSGLGSATQGIRELMEQAALDGGVADRAAGLVNLQLDAVELVLQREFDTTATVDFSPERPAEVAWSPEARLALAAVLIGILQFFMAYLAYLGDLQSREQDAQAAAETDAHRRRMLEVMQRLADQATRAASVQPGLVAVGPQPLTVRSKPGAGDRIGVVYPNQVLEQTGHEGRWLKVRFRDHLEERDIEGWVLKHRVQPLARAD